MACVGGETIKRLDVPIPFFLNDKPFREFGRVKYNWDTDRKITLLFRNVKKEQGRQGALEASSSNINNLTISGCPLECPFDPNENFEEALGVYAPKTLFQTLDYMGEPVDKIVLSSKVAKDLRLALGKYDENIVSDLSLQKLCDKQAFLNTIYIPALNQPKKGVISALYGYDSGYITEVTVEGPIKNPQDLPMQYISKTHYPFNSSTSTSPAVTQVHAIYEKIHGVYPADGKVFIEVFWSNPERVFSPPPGNASVKLAIKPFAGDANPFLKKLWREIQALDNFMREYENSGSMDPNQSYHSLSMTEFHSEKIDELSEILNQQFAPHAEKMLDFSDSLESNLDRVSEGDRTDIDFTDRIWRILANGVSSIQDVYECFHMIFCNIESKLYRPYLFPTNKTLFNGILKKVMSNNKPVNFRSILSPHMAVCLALDCGINKLFKDYSFVLRMCHLAETSDLESFAPNVDDPKGSLECVKKLHCILEVLCLCKERLGISMSTQEHQTRSMFDYLQAGPLEWDKTYHFDVGMNTVTSVLEGMKPIYWNLQLESELILKIKRTNCIITKDFFIDHAKKEFSSNGILLDGYYVYIHHAAKYTVGD